MMALRILGDVDEAQDAVQEAFAHTWSRIAEGADIVDFKPYIYRAVRNEALRRLRDAAPLTDAEMAEDVPEETVDTAERDAALWKAVDSLPERCRRVFLMSKRDGMTNAAIAEELGISIKTVEAQMTKALRTLRLALMPHRSTQKIFFLPFF